MDEKVNLRLHNAMIEVAVCEFWEKMIAETDWSKDGDHEFSDRHTAKIKAVIKKHKAKARRRKLFHAARRVAIVILVLCTVSFGTLMACSATVREEVYRITMLGRNWLSEVFTGKMTPEEAMDHRIDAQIDQLANILSDALDKAGFPQNTNLSIHINGYLKMSISGLDGRHYRDVFPVMQDEVFERAFADTLSTAYARPGKNEIYYIQSAIRNRDELMSDTSESAYELRADWEKIIQEYRFANNGISEEEIMQQMRLIQYFDGKLIYKDL